MSLKEAYTGGARAIASRSMTGLARTRVTPNMLTAAGVSLCAVGAVLVYFEYRSDWFYFFGGLAFVVGSIADVLDGALARAGGKQTPFGGFLDSTLDRVGEGLDARRDLARLHARRQGARAGARASPRSAARSSSRTRGRRPKGSGSRATSASARAPSGWP